MTITKIFAIVVHSNLDLGVVLVSRELTPKSREILNQGFHVKIVLTILFKKAQSYFKSYHIRQIIQVLITIRLDICKGSKPMINILPAKTTQILTISNK